MGVGQASNPQKGNFGHSHTGRIPREGMPKTDSKLPEARRGPYIIHS